MTPNFSARTSSEPNEGRPSAIPSARRTPDGGLPWSAGGTAKEGALTDGVHLTHSRGGSTPPDAHTSSARALRKDEETHESQDDARVDSLRLFQRLDLPRLSTGDE